MERLFSLITSPEFLMFTLAGVTAVGGLALRGAKAQFTDEITTVIDRKFSDHALVESAHDDLVNVAMGALKDEVNGLKVSIDEVKEDVSEIARDVKTIMSNGHFRK